MAKTTYKDASGNTQTGYIINGKTYKDEAGTQRIDAGSQVTAGGQTYVYLGNERSVPLSEYTASMQSANSGGGYVVPNTFDINQYLMNAPQYNSDSYLQSIQRALSSAKSANDAATQGYIYNLQSQIPDINKKYADLQKQTYTNSRLSAIGNNEQLAAAGLSGNAYNSPQSGYTETSRIRQDNALRTNIANLSRDEQNALKELQDAIAKAKLEGESRNAQLEGEYGLKMADARRYADEMNNQNYWNTQNLGIQVGGMLGYYNGMPTLQAQQMNNENYWNNKNYGLQQAQLTGVLNGQQTLDAQQQAWNQQYQQKLFDYQKSQDEYQKQQDALANMNTKLNNELSMFGKVMSSDVANYFGVPVGTQSYEATAAAQARQDQLSQFASQNALDWAKLQQDQNQFNASLAAQPTTYTSVFSDPQYKTIISTAADMASATNKTTDANGLEVSSPKFTTQQILNYLDANVEDLEAFYQIGASLGLTKQQMDSYLGINQPTIKDMKTALGN